MSEKRVENVVDLPLRFDLVALEKDIAEQKGDLFSARLVHYLNWSIVQSACLSHEFSAINVSDVPILYQRFY